MHLVSVVAVLYASLAFAKWEDHKLLQGEDDLCTGVFNTAIDKCVQQNMPHITYCRHEDFDCLCRWSHFLTTCYDKCHAHKDRPQALEMKRKYCEANATYGDLTNTIYKIPEHGNAIGQMSSPDPEPWEEQLRDLEYEKEEEETHEKEKNITQEVHDRLLESDSNVVKLVAVVKGSTPEYIGDKYDLRRPDPPWDE